MGGCGNRKIFSARGPKGGKLILKELRETHEGGLRKNLLASVFDKSGGEVRVVSTTDVATYVSKEKCRQSINWEERSRNL